MAIQPARNRKLHSFSKSERLCNFTLKNLLFSQGSTFYEHPFKIYWKVISPDLEPLFFGASVTAFTQSSSESNWKREQNPSYPFKIVPRNALFTHPAQVLIAVPSKVHRKAVVRNHLKRLIREAYRQNKDGMYAFLQHTQMKCILAIVYTGKSVLAYHEIKTKIIVSLQKIEKKILEQQNN